MRHVLRATRFGVALLASSAAMAQPANYPVRPVRMVIPFAAGSQTDIVARLIGQKLAEKWGQQIVVDPRPSAGGTIAGGIVAKSAPDGHTLVLHSISLAVNASLYSRLPYDTLRDFAGVTQIGSVPNVLIVPGNSSVKTAKELIAAAKQAPGTLNFGSAGIGTGTHMNGEQFKLMAGVNAVHVPYKGMLDAIADTATGRIHYAFSSITPVVPFIKERRVQALAVSTAARSPVLPDVPTLAEAAIPGFEFDLWFGVLAPGRTPKPLIDHISREIRQVVDLPDIRTSLLNQGAVPKTSTPEEFDKFVRAEVERLAKVVKASGAKAD